VGRSKGDEATVLCVDDPLIVNSELAVPLAEIDFRTSRSSGPGGQHANVTASRVEAVFDVRESASLSEPQRRRLESRYGDRVTAVAQDARSQARNRELAAERLREKLAAGLVVRRKRRPTKPSKAAKERRLDAKRRASERKSKRRPPSIDD
jgi:ribosome-associated protein